MVHTRFPVEAEGHSVLCVEAKGRPSLERRKTSSGETRLHWITYSLLWFLSAGVGLTLTVLSELCLPRSALKVLGKAS